MITRSVADLEDRLGLVLLNRTTRSVRLTERGEIFLESCRQVLEDIEGAERRVRGEDAEPRGSLKVAAPILFGRLHVLPIVTQVLTKHPGLSNSFDAVGSQRPTWRRNLSTSRSASATWPTAV